MCDFDEGWRASLSIDRVGVMKIERSEDHPYYLFLFKYYKIRTIYY